MMASHSIAYHTVAHQSLSHHSLSQGYLSLPLTTMLITAYHGCPMNQTRRVMMISMTIVMMIGFIKESNHRGTNASESLGPSKV